MSDEARNLTNDIMSLIGGPSATEGDAVKLAALVLRETRRAAKNDAFEVAAKVAMRNGDHDIAAAIRKLKT